MFRIVGASAVMVLFVGGVLRIRPKLRGQRKERTQSLTWWKPRHGLGLARANGLGVGLALSPHQPCRVNWIA